MPSVLAVFRLIGERAAEQDPPEAKCCAAAPPVLLFDQSGNLLRTWGGPGTGYQWPQSEHGTFIDDNDFVWFAGNDSNATDRLGSPADVAVDTAAKVDGEDRIPLLDRKLFERRDMLDAGMSLTCPLGPIRGAQHLHEGRCDRGALPAPRRHP